MIYDKNSTCCFTGHRELPVQLLGKISSAISSEATRLYTENSVRNFITGGAVGFDLLAAETLIGMRFFFKDIRLILALPCEYHYSKWSENEQQRFFNIAESADETVYVTRKYENGCMLRRDRFMVDVSRYCISYCVRRAGGTYYTVRYAYKNNLDVTEISEIIRHRAE